MNPGQPSFCGSSIPDWSQVCDRELGYGSEQQVFEDHGRMYESCSKPCFCGVPARLASACCSEDLVGFVDFSQPIETGHATA